MNGDRLVPAIAILRTTSALRSPASFGVWDLGPVSLHPLALMYFLLCESCWFEEPATGTSAAGEPRRRKRRRLPAEPPLHRASATVNRASRADFETHTAKVEGSNRPRATLLGTLAN
jgi:hypothetical protein